MKRPLLSIAAVLGSVATSLPALQMPDGEAPFATAAETPAGLGSVPRRSFGVGRSDGVLVGGGPDYKVSFEPGRFEFTPALGARVERNFPISFELESVLRGGELVRAAAPAAAPREDGERVVYDHGGGLTERYDVAAAGVHQSFLLVDDPGGSGDLVLRGRIETDLRPALDAGGGLSFELEPGTGVSWGGVTGIAADGARAAGELRLDGSHLELVLPGAFVDGAAWPLVVDPLIGAQFGVANTAADDDGLPDIAFDRGGRWLAVWRRHFSLTDADVRGQRLDSAGNLLGGMLSIATGGALSTEPAVANVNATNRFLVTWQEAPNFLLPPAVVARSVLATNGNLSNAVTVSPSGNVQLGPDVGGERTLADDDAVVVWRETGVGIRSRQVSVPAAADPVPFGATLTLDASASAANVAISKTAGDAGRFLVVWEVLTNNPFVRGRAITRNNSFVGEPASISFFVTGIGTNIEPDVDGDGTSFVVAWSRDESLNSGVFDVYCRSVTVEGDELELGTLRAVEADDDDDERDPAVAFTETECVIAYLDRDLDYNVYVKSVEPGTCLPCQEAGQASFNGTQDSSVAIASTWQGGDGGDADTAFLVWQSVGLDGDQDVFAHRFGTPAEAAPLGGGCGGGGEAVAACPYAGNASFQVRLEGAAPGVPAVAILGIETATFDCGGCTLFPSLDTAFYFADTTDGAGNASVNVPLPGGLLDIGIPIQWAVLSGASCPTFGVDLSDAVRIDF